MVLANPPFGKKQSLLFVNEEGDVKKEIRSSSVKTSGPRPAISN